MLAHGLQHRHAHRAQRVVRPDVVVVHHAHRQALVLRHVREAERLLVPHWVQVRRHRAAGLRSVLAAAHKHHGVRVAGAVAVRRREVARLQQPHLQPEGDEAGRAVCTFAAGRSRLRGHSRQPSRCCAARPRNHGLLARCGTGNRWPGNYLRRCRLWYFVFIIGCCPRT